jgi:hypothetical protein
MITIVDKKKPPVGVGGFFLVGPLKRYRLLTHFSCASLASSKTGLCLVLLIHVDLFFPTSDCASIISYLHPNRRERLRIIFGIDRRSLSQLQEMTTKMACAVAGQVVVLGRR